MYTNKYAHMEGISFPPFFPLKTLQHSQQGNIWMHIQQPAVGMPNLPAESRFEIPKKKMLQLIFTVCNTQNMKYMKYTYCVYMRWYICNVYIICMYIHIYIHNINIFLHTPTSIQKPFLTAGPGTETAWHSATGFAPRHESHFAASGATRRNAKDQGGCFQQIRGNRAPQNGW